MKDLNSQDKKINMQDADLNSQSKDSVRLQAFLAHCGVASRRACEEIILAGRVSVNGQIVDKLGAKVKGNEIIYVDDKPVSLEEKKRYVLLYKPEGYVSSLSDEKNRTVAADLLKETYNERLYNIGRLDMYSSGLLLFTNDGDFAALLSHPSSGVEKEYIVDTFEPLPIGFAEKFSKGIRFEDVFYKAKSSTEINKHKMRVVLVEGKNREIRTVLKSVNVRVRKLVRIRFGCVTVEGLTPGKFRDLTDLEVKSLSELAMNSKYSK